jgi:membrane-associated phospholipid phosphatase
MNQGSVFGTLFQNYGLFPTSLVLFLSAQVIAARGYNQEEKSVANAIVILAGLGFALFATFQCVDNWLYYTYSSLNNLQHGLPIGVANNDGGSVAYPYYLKVLISFILWAIGSAISFKWLHGKTKQQMKYLSIVAVAGIAIVFASDTIVNNMKDVWGRFRPYEIADKVQGAHYTPWYHLNGVNGHKSFPSGHSQTAWTALFLPFFVDRSNVKLQRIMVKATAGFGALMAISRVVIGAHFLSDVTVGSSVTILTVFVAAKLMNVHFVESDEYALSYNEAENTFGETVADTKIA